MLPSFRSGRRANRFALSCARCRAATSRWADSPLRRKRLQRPPGSNSVTNGLHRIRIVGGGEFSCGEDERVLIAMERCGASDIGVGCRGGGCGMCRVQVVSGDYVTGKMSRSRITEQAEAAGLVLACRLYPLSDLILEADCYGHPGDGVEQAKKDC